MIYINPIYHFCDVKKHGGCHVPYRLWFYLNKDTRSTTLKHRKNKVGNIFRCLWTTTTNSAYIKIKTKQ